MEQNYYKLSSLCTIDKGKSGINKTVPGQYTLITTGEEHKSSNKYDFDCKAVCVPLVSSTGHGHASIKRLHYYEGKFALGTILAKITSKDETILSTEYLYIYLSFYKDDILVPLMKGSANVSLTTNALEMLEIKVPDIDIQNKIVELVRKIEPKINNLNMNLNMQHKLIIELRDRAIRMAVRGHIVSQDPDEENVKVVLKKVIEENSNRGIIRSNIKQDEKFCELPIGWEWARLDDIVAINDNSIRRGPFGSAIRKDMFVPKGNNTYKVYEQRNVIKKDHTLGEYYINGEKYKELIRFNVEPGDILITCAGTIGEMYLIPENIEKGIINQALLKIQLNNIIMDNEFFIYLFQSITKAKVNEDSMGSAMKNLTSVKYLKENVVFPLPPISEQKRIITVIKKILAQCEKLEESIEDEKENSSILIRALLSKVLSA